MVDEGSCRAVDARWAPVLQVEAAEIRRPGDGVLVNVYGDRFPLWKRWEVQFFALFVDVPDAPATIACRPEFEAEVRSIDFSRPREVVEERLIEVARLASACDTYVFDMRVAPQSTFDGVEADQAVAEFAAGDVSIRDWDGTSTADEVDGPVFAMTDERGLTAWAGVKRCSNAAQDIQVATREDKRRQGLAKRVSLQALRCISNDGFVPYYAHLRTNGASRALANSLGFEYYGSAVIAERDIAKG